MTARLPKNQIFRFWSASNVQFYSVQLSEERPALAVQQFCKSVKPYYSLNRIYQHFVRYERRTLAAAFFLVRSVSSPSITRPFNSCSLPRSDPRRASLASNHLSGILGPAPDFSSLGRKMCLLYLSLDSYYSAVFPTATSSPL